MYKMKLYKPIKEWYKFFYLPDSQDSSKYVKYMNIIFTWLKTI